MTTAPYVYRVTDVHRIVDGDTFHLEVDVGFYLTAAISVRLLGVDCPEIHGPTDFERAEAAHAKTSVTAWFTTHLPAGVWVRTEKTDDFGRWLGDLWTELPEGVMHLADGLAALHLATPWPTRWRDVYVSPDHT